MKKIFLFHTTYDIITDIYIIYSTEETPTLELGGESIQADQFDLSRQKHHSSEITRKKIKFLNLISLHGPAGFKMYFLILEECINNETKKVYI